MSPQVHIGMLLPLLFLAAVILLSLGLKPQSCEVVGNDLRVHTLLKTFHFDLTQATAFETTDARSFNWRNTLRLCGVGWPMKPYGWFWNRQLGRFLAMANDMNHLLLVRFPERQLLVSPSNPQDLPVQPQQRST